jgi:hypothetical protein
MRRMLNIGSLVLIVAAIVIEATVLPSKTVADTNRHLIRGEGVTFFESPSPARPRFYKIPCKIPC